MWYAQMGIVFQGVASVAWTQVAKSVVLRVKSKTIIRFLHLNNPFFLQRTVRSTRVPINQRGAPSGYYERRSRTNWAKHIHSQYPHRGVTTTIFLLRSQVCSSLDFPQNDDTFKHYYAGWSLLCCINPPPSFHRVEWARTHPLARGPSYATSQSSFTLRIKIYIRHDCNCTNSNTKVKYRSITQDLTPRTLRNLNLNNRNKDQAQTIPIQIIVLMIKSAIPCWFRRTELLAIICLAVHRSMSMFPVPIQYNQSLHSSRGASLRDSKFLEQ